MAFSADAADLLESMSMVAEFSMSLPGFAGVAAASGGYRPRPRLFIYSTRAMWVVA